MLVDLLCSKCGKRYALPPEQALPGIQCPFCLIPMIKVEALEPTAAAPAKDPASESTSNALDFLAEELTFGGRENQPKQPRTPADGADWSSFVRGTISIQIGVFGHLLSGLILAFGTYSFEPRREGGFDSLLNLLMIGFSIGILAQTIITLGHFATRSSPDPGASKLAHLSAVGSTITLAALVLYVGLFIWLLYDVSARQVDSTALERKLRNLMLLGMFITWLAGITEIIFLLAIHQAASVRKMDDVIAVARLVIGLIVLYLCVLLAASAFLMKERGELIGGLAKRDSQAKNWAAILLSLFAMLLLVAYAAFLHYTRQAIRSASRRGSKKRQYPPGFEGLD